MANNIEKMMAVIVLSVLTTTTSVYSLESCNVHHLSAVKILIQLLYIQGDCNNITSFCSLTSAIDYIASSSREQWIIQVNYNHSIDQVSATVNVSCLIICGIGQPYYRY